MTLVGAPSRAKSKASKVIIIYDARRRDSTSASPVRDAMLLRLAHTPTRRMHMRASSTDDAHARIATLTALPPPVVASLLSREDCPDAKALFTRMTLLRRLVPRADTAHMVSIEPMLLLEPDDEAVEYSARDALETLSAFVGWPNVVEFIVQEEPSLLLGTNGQMRLEELRDAAEYYRENLAAVAGDGREWLDVNAQRYVSNFFVQYY